MDAFRFSADLVKAEAQTDGTYVLEGMASLPGRDLQHEELDPQGLEIDYFLGKGLPRGAGGYINYDHDPSTIVGYPEAGRIGPNGFWIRWRTINTPFVHRIMEQMRALKEAGWPRRYGLSVEGVVEERDPEDPTHVRRAFVRNVALTPTPVHPGTFTDFAKSLTAASQVQWDPRAGAPAAVRGWVQDMAQIVQARVPVEANRYFQPSGRLRPEADRAYFTDVWGLDPAVALELAHYVARHEDRVHKALQVQAAQARVRRHLQRQRQRAPTDPHVRADGRIQGGDRAVAAHFIVCEKRPRPEVVGLVRLLHGSSLVVSGKESHG